ncbi:MAG: 3-hydroxyisobutyrate dehydrogenase [Pseudomonadota bacterium]|nr:3-hydroxyisobutyrate dehydrogenase [Pseudomonadota bacterium]
MAKIGFIGLGNMGGPMSANLVKAGHDVCGYDIIPEKIDWAVSRGVTPATSNPEAVKDAEFVFAMLPTGNEVRHVLADGDKVFDLVSTDTIVVDSSTTDLGVTEYIHKQAALRGIAMIDSPVSGGMAGAEAATLTFMAGGDGVAIDIAEPIFLAMGKKVVRAGGASAGQAVKVCNNMLLGISMAGACEAIALGEAAGVDHQVLFDVISTSTGGCWAMNVNCPMPEMVDTSPANRGYTPGFTATLMLKDLTLSQEAASKTGAVTPLGEHARQLYEAFCENRDGELDFSAMIQMIRDLERPKT